MTRFAQLMTCQVQHRHPQLVIKNSAVTVRDNKCNVSSVRQPCLYQMQLVVMALWSRHSRYNGTWAAPSWDFIHTHMHAHTSCALESFSFAQLNDACIRRVKSALTRWQKRANESCHKMHKKNNIKEIWKKQCNSVVFSVFYIFFLYTHKVVSLQ